MITMMEEISELAHSKGLTAIVSYDCLICLDYVQS